MSGFTMELLLCNAGVVEGEYLDELARLRALGGDPPYTGGPFACTGSAHLAGQHIRCTSPFHARPVALPPLVDHKSEGLALVRVANEVRGHFSGDPGVPADFLDDLTTIERVGRRLYFSVPLTAPFRFPMAGVSC